MTEFQGDNLIAVLYLILASLNKDNHIIFMMWSIISSLWIAGGLVKLIANYIGH